MSPFRLSSRTLAARGSAGAVSVPGPVPVPWRVTRRQLGIIELEYRGSAPARSVRFALAGSGMLGLSLPATVQPGEHVRVSVRGTQASAAAASHDAMLVLRWFQPDGTELLWPIPVD